MKTIQRLQIYFIFWAILIVFIINSSSTAAAATKYTVHCASYKIQQQAAGDAQKLAAMGYSAFFVPVDLKAKGKWYRVYAGQFETKDKARLAAEEMVRKNVISTYFIFPLSADQSPVNKRKNDNSKNLLADKQAEKSAHKQFSKLGVGSLHPAGNKELVPVLEKTPVSSSAAQIKTEKQPVSTSIKQDKNADEKKSVSEIGKNPAALLTEKNSSSGNDKEQIPLEKQEAPSGSALYDRGLNEMKEKNYEKALITFKEFVARPDTSKTLGERALRHMADCHFFLGQMGSKEHLQIAVGFYKNTLESFPDQKRDNSLTYFRLARTYEYLKKYSDALINYERLLAKYPGSSYVPEASFKIGEMLHAIGKYNEAVGKLIAYLTRYRGGTYAKQAFYIAADCYYKMKQSASAEVWFQDAQKKWPDLSDIPKEVIIDMGQHKLSLRRYDEAISIFSFYVNLYADDEKVKEVLLLLANSYKDADQSSAALTIYNKIIVKYPESKEAQQSIMAIASLGVDKPGVKVFSALNNNFLYYRHPLEAYNMLLKNQTGETAEQALLQKGDALHKLKRDRSAADVYLEFLKKYPQSKMADEARKGLKLASVTLIDESYRKKDYLAVADMYFKAYRDLPLQTDEYETVNKIATSLHEIGLTDDYMNLLKDYRTACKDDILAVKVMLLMAEGEMARRNYKEAEKILGELLAQPAVHKTSLMPAIKKNLAEIADQKGSNNQAALDFDAAVRSGQVIHQDLKYWSLLQAGQSYLKIDNNAEAQKKFTQIKTEAGPEGFWTKIADYYVGDQKWWDKYGEYLKN